MIDGMIMDVPGIGKNRYQTFEELELYCYRVAGTVGLMVLPILGTAEGVSEEDAKFPALSLGIALQLTNILRDVGEDAVRGRIYLPLEVCACVMAFLKFSFSSFVGTLWLYCAKGFACCPPPSFSLLLLTVPLTVPLLFSQ